MNLLRKTILSVATMLALTNSVYPMQPSLYTRFKDALYETCCPTIKYATLLVAKPTTLIPAKPQIKISGESLKSLIPAKPNFSVSPTVMAVAAAAVPALYTVMRLKNSYTTLQEPVAQAQDVTWVLDDYKITNVGRIRPLNILASATCRTVKYPADVTRNADTMYTSFIREFKQPAETEAACRQRVMHLVNDEKRTLNTIANNLYKGLQASTFLPKMYPRALDTEFYNLLADVHTMNQAAYQAADVYVENFCRLSITNPLKLMRSCLFWYELEAVRHYWKVKTLLAYLDNVQTVLVQHDALAAVAAPVVVPAGAPVVINNVR